MQLRAVAPFTGAWIEILAKVKDGQSSHVAPFTGAWIEIEINRIVYEMSFVAPFKGWVCFLV